MHDRDTRLTVLHLHSKGLGKRAIARTLGLSRNTVRSTLDSGEADVPGLGRPAQLDEHLDVVRDLRQECGGNLVRVAEELEHHASIEVGYSTLTHFCRREGNGRAAAAGTWFPRVASPCRRAQGHRDL